MRPTEFGLKAPCNRTPFPNDILVNYNGSSIKTGHSKTGFSFSSTRRFNHYSMDASKLGFRVGPGSYDTSHNNVGKAKADKLQIYRQNSYKSILPKEGLYYSGNLLVYDDKFVPSSKRKTSRNQSMSSAFVSTRGTFKAASQNRTKAK